MEAYVKGHRNHTPQSQSDSSPILGEQLKKIKKNIEKRKEEDIKKLECDACSGESISETIVLSPV